MHLYSLGYMCVCICIKIAWEKCIPTSTSFYLLSTYYAPKLRARREQLRRQQEDIQETLSELDRLEQQSSALLAEREPPMAKAAG